MEITPDHVTILHTKVVVYRNGPECPVCGVLRMWRIENGQWICGTRKDSGRKMDPQVPCASCRENGFRTPCDWPEVEEAKRKFLEKEAL